MLRLHFNYKSFPESVEVEEIPSIEGISSESPSAIQTPEQRAASSFQTASM